MIRFTQRELDAILGEFLGKPYKRFASGPDAYDCYGLVKAFMARIGVDIPEIGAVNPNDSRPIYEQQQTDYVRIEWPRPWSLVTFSGKDLNAHIGVVLPNDNLFLHCPGRAAGKVLAEPLSRRPWRDTIDGYWWPKSVLESIIMLTPMTTKRAWQFVKCDGRSLGEIIEQDITDGRDVQVQAFIDGQLVEVDDWTMIPSPVNQLVVRPVVGEGDQMGMMAGMVALAMLAPYIAGPLAGVSSGAATAAGGYGAAAWAAGGSTAFAYGLANAAVMMGGALALNALIGPGEGAKDASQHYAWDPQT
ncbi:MAG: NlpC/P60 family protein, partial [Candidatus Neomarinimicrobiota bacterium]